ncbi:MAG: outer membrane protein [Rhodomicrobium sp.]
MLRRVILGAVSVIAFTAAANAADMYVPGPAGGYKDAYVPVDTWAGFYAGVNGGYGWSANNSTLSETETYQGNNVCTLAPCGTLISGSQSFSTEGWFGGGQIGYNWQPAGAGGYKDGPVLGNFVFGIEADIQGADINGSGTVVVGGVAATASNTLDWFGTVRGRLGYSFGSALLYATGGFAYGGVEDKLSVLTSTVSNSYTATGYAVGGGIEYKLTPAWSVKAEYQYIDLGSDKLATTAAYYIHASAEYEHEYNTVRLGVNYHFLPAYEPLK